MGGGLVEGGPLAAGFGAVLALEHLEVVHEGRHDDLLVPVAEQVGDDGGGVDAGGDLGHPSKAQVRGALVLGAPRLLVVVRVGERLAIEEFVVAAVAVSHNPVVGDGVGHLRQSGRGG